MNDLIQHWEGEMVISHYDRPAESWIFVGIHSTALGPAAGGTRMMHYASPEDALRDCLKLARGMTMKYAVADFPRGGGKAVIAVPKDLPLEARRELLLRYGKLIKRLNGLFQTGPDVGTSTPDMDVIAETGAPFVFCRSVENGGAGNSSELTAHGVFHAIRATLAHLDGAADWKRRTVLVQGLGNVGARLTELLLIAGARLLVSDTNPELQEKYAADQRVFFIAPAEVFATACDVFAPCALGGILNRETIPQLRCRAVVGAANNQLADSAAASWLHERGILYAPDFVVNVGGAMGITGMEAMRWSAAQAASEVAKIGDTLGRVFRVAAHKQLTTAAAAEKIAAETLARYRST